MKIENIPLSKCPAFSKVSWNQKYETISLFQPSLVGLFRYPSPMGFIRSVVYCGLVSFLVGFHVHEKAILIPLLSLLPLAVMSRPLAGVYVLLSAVGHFSLFPLIHTRAELFIKAVLVAFYGFYITYALSCAHRYCGSLYTRYVSVYIQWSRASYVCVILNIARWFSLQIPAPIPMGTTLSFRSNSPVHLHRTFVADSDTETAVPSTDGNVCLLCPRRARLLPANACCRLRRR